MNGAAGRGMVDPMGRAQRITLLTAEEYLAGEKAARVKHEFLAGRAHAMAGASRRHVRIVQAMVAAIGARLRRGCDVLSTDIKVRVEAADAYYYPDVVVACDPTDADPYVVERPSLVVEVLSESTEAIDRREKLPAYQSIPGLAAVLLVHQERRMVEVYRRDELGWLLETVEDDGIAEVPALGLALPLGEIYAGTGDPTPG
jgi:Uma2 family endonuclease